MKKLVSTLNMTYKEWLGYRKMGIGGSDAGAICGLNPYSSPMNVYYDKTTEGEDLLDNEAMRQGRDLEEYVAKRFTEATGKKVRRSNAIYQHQDYSFMLANVDRLIIGENAGLECKTASPYNAGKWKDGEIPSHYFIQCLHYMAVTGADAWYLAVVILGQEFKFVKIERDESAIRDLIVIESNFWNHHVIPRVMPEPDGSEICDEVISRYFPIAKKEETILLVGFDEKLKRKEELNLLIKKLEAENRRIDQEVKLYMGECESAFTEHYRVSWSNVDMVRVDSKRLKEERPDLYANFSKSSQSRRFTFKVA